MAAVGKVVGSLTLRLGTEAQWRKDETLSGSFIIVCTCRVWCLASARL